MKTGGTSALTPPQWRQLALITAAAVALFVLVRRLPTGTNLNHIDFRVTGSNSIEFCDPANPQFIPVVQVRSPVTMTLSADRVETGREQAFTLTLRTFTGKPIGPEDLAVAHTKKLHLLIVDPSLEDYQHVHPVPSALPGEWRFSLTPRRTGQYRVFADFVPIATGRGLYAVAEFTATGNPAAIPTPPVALGPNAAVTRDGYRFALTAKPPVIKARAVAELAFTVTRSDGGTVPLQPVMGAFAHLVAFDADRRGFAHLHPNEAGLTPPPDASHPRLTFKIMIPQPGPYVIWAQVNLGGREEFVPFSIVVAP
jgi:hypothetical protein